MFHYSYIYSAYVIHINCGITLVVMNNTVCPTRWSLVLEATCLIARLTPRSPMPEVNEMLACLTFMSLLSDESLSNSGHPRDCHMRSDLSHSTSPPASLQATRVRMMLYSWVFVHRKSHHCTDISTVLLCTGGGS